MNNSNQFGSTEKSDTNNAVQMILYLGLALLIIGIVFLFYSHQSGKKITNQMHEVEKELSSSKNELSAVQDSHRRALVELDRMRDKMKEMQQERKILSDKLATSKKWFGAMQDNNRQLTDVMYDIRLSMSEYIVMLKQQKDPALEKIAHELADYAFAMDDLFASNRPDDAPPKTGKAAAIPQEKQTEIKSGN